MEWPREKNIPDLVSSKGNPFQFIPNTLTRSFPAENQQVPQE